MNAIFKTRSEIQWVSAKSKRVKGIYHRGLNEGVTELLTIFAYSHATPAYNDLLPFARKLIESVGFESLSHIYFREGYPGLEKLAKKRAFNLRRLDHLADAALGF